MSYTITVNTTIGGTGNAINSVGYMANDTAQGAQKFTTVGAGSVSKVTLECARDGSDSTLYYVQIFADNGSGTAPSGSSLGTSSSIMHSAFPAVTSFQCALTALVPNDFTFASPVSVSGSTIYWAVLTTQGIYTSNAIRMCGDVTSNHGSVLDVSTSTPTTWATVSSSAAYCVVTVDTTSPSTGNFFQFMSR